MTFKEKVEKVKRIPIPKYMEVEVVPRLRNYYGNSEGTFRYGLVEKCPLHNEDTPSFRYYEDTNSCACFGCRRGGDVINLHRVFFEVNEDMIISYKDAVDYLYSHFIEGDTSVELSKSSGNKDKRTKNIQKLKEQHKANGDDNFVIDAPSNVEVMRFLRKRNEKSEKIRMSELSSTELFKKAMLLDFTSKLYRLGELDINSASDIIARI